MAQAYERNYTAKPAKPVDIACPHCGGIIKVTVNFKDVRPEFQEDVLLVVPVDLDKSS